MTEPHVKVRGIFDAALGTERINFKELLAVKLVALFHFSELYGWNDCTIKVCSDNTTALAYIKHFAGIKSKPLDCLAAELLDFVKQTHSANHRTHSRCT